MIEIDYACATRPEEVVFCSKLKAGNYPAEYAERVKGILADIKDDGLRKRVESTLGEFESGSDGKLAQSSPYKLVVLQEILPKGKVLVVRPRLQIARDNTPNFMYGFYVDCGLNLVSSEKGYQCNSVLAEELAEDLRNVGIDLLTPKLIPINALTYKVNANPKLKTGLSLRLSEQEKDNAKSLVLNTLDLKWNYLPSNSGLFRACLDVYGDWDAGVGLLADSNDSSRVVVETTGEANSHEIGALNKQAEELLNRQKREREDLVRKIIG